MPELPSFNPSVSVFHFSSKVSNAKIKKYKLATERGMTSTNTSIAAGEIHQVMANKRVRRTIGPSMPVLSTEEDGDTLILAPPHVQNGKKRDWVDAFVHDATPAKTIRESSTSSELSSCDSNILESGAPVLFKTAKDTEQAAYGDFMSYYVQDDEDAAPKQPKSQSSVAQKPPVSTSSVTIPNRNTPVHSSTKQPKIKRTRKVTTPERPKSSSFSTAQKQDTTQQPSSVMPQVVRPMSLPQQRPRPHSVSTQLLQAPSMLNNIRIRKTDSIPVMVEKLEALSAALTSFGAPAPADLPEHLPQPEQTGQSGAKIQGSEHTSAEDLVDMSTRGEHDFALISGVHFIMTALHSWGERRLEAEKLARATTNAYSLQQATGRPKTISDAMSILTASAEAAARPQSAEPSLNDTPEGRAIASFRTLLESGCLRVNTRMPARLARALRHFYVQLDRIINLAPPKTEPPWRCLSYRAQIEANRVRLEGLRDAQTKAQEESLQQMQAAHQTVMRQMGLPAHLTKTVFSQIPQRQQDHIASPIPHNSVGSSAPRLTSSQAARSMPPIMMSPTGLPSMSMSNLQAYAPQAYSALSQLRGATGINGNTAGLMSRTGDAMKFSFPPTHPAAIQAFGHQSFPALHSPPKAQAPKQPVSAPTTLTPAISTFESQPKATPAPSGFTPINGVNLKDDGSDRLITAMQIGTTKMASEAQIIDDVDDT